MADYDIFREQLAIKYPSYGHALWGPSPRNPDRPVQVGDVGFILRGKFHRLFNALLPADDPSHEFGVPEYHEPLVPNLLNHLDTDSLGRNNYCSAGVSVESDPGYNLSPDDFPQVTFQYKRTRGAAVLSLPVTARREDTLARGDFKRWIVKHIDNWLVFARKLGLGIEQMEEIILVTGCDRTRSWTNVAFLGSQTDAQVSFGVKVDGPDTNINFQFSPEHARGAVLRHGPEGMNLPENQCVFIRGFRVARSFWILPRRLKAAAGPSPDTGGYGCDPEAEVISIPAIAKYRDPLILLLDYITEQASDCDMALAHDDDLVAIDGLGHDTSLETLEPDVMTDLLRRSNIEIHKASCDLSPTDSGPNTNKSVVKVAMVSRKLRNYIGPQSQMSPLAGQNINLGHTSESRGLSPPAVPGSLPPPTIRGDTSKGRTPTLTDYGESAPSTLQGLADSTIHAAEDILVALGKIRNSTLNLSKFERDRLMTAVVVTCCAVSLLGWVFSLTWNVVFKLFFTLFLASFPLSVWFEREHTYRRRLDDMYERLEILHHHVVSLQLNTAVPTLVNDVGISLPIVARSAPANPGTLESSMQAIVQPDTPGPSKHIEPLVETSTTTPYDVQALQEDSSDAAQWSATSLIGENDDISQDVSKQKPHARETGPYVPFPTDLGPAPGPLPDGPVSRLFFPLRSRYSLPILPTVSPSYETDTEFQPPSPPTFGGN